MKKKMQLTIFTLLIILTSSFITMAQEKNREVQKTITRANGTIDVIGGQYVIIDNDTEGQRYMPENLADNFKIKRLKVTFSGDVYTVAPNIRVVASPMKLTEIIVQRENEEKEKPQKPMYPQDPVFNYDKKLDNVKGTIKQMGSTWLIVGEKTQYAPGFLPKEYKIDGMKVIFSGETGPPPPYVKMMGNPLKIDEIKEDLTKKSIDKPAPPKKKKRWWQFWK